MTKKEVIWREILFQSTENKNLNLLKKNWLKSTGFLWARFLMP